MGISRSGSTVVAYAMKKQHWPLDLALNYVTDRRSVVRPNDGFMKQLQLYNGILNARSDPELGVGGRSSLFTCQVPQPRVFYKRGHDEKKIIKIDLFMF